MGGLLVLIRRAVLAVIPSTEGTGAGTSTSATTAKDADEEEERDPDEDVDELAVCHR